MRKKEIIALLKEHEEKIKDYIFVVGLLEKKVEEFEKELENIKIVASDIKTSKTLKNQKKWLRGMPDDKE